MSSQLMSKIFGLVNQAQVENSKEGIDGLPLIPLPGEEDVSNSSSMAINNMSETADQNTDLVSQGMGYLDFLSSTDLVGKTLFFILLAMSFITWYLIFVKGISNTITKRRVKSFQKMFWNSASLNEVERNIQANGAKDPFSRLCKEAIYASKYHSQYGATNLSEVGTGSEFVTRHMRKIIDAQTARLENGLALLSSIGATAPFVGLFGTVWGVYHALVKIGLSDGVVINEVAGPVGEALIMTGLGLAVAIPAVLALNFFVRRNRLILAQLDGFAYDLFAFVTTGQQMKTNPYALKNIAAVDVSTQ